ncbi:helix-turn-helix domain-containing protein [Enterovibrio nigricans]|uniref:AraC-type DNA-binding protein n=1 Tax=Enterovibrio nigricans DSM 22720 TaxID=1121868 RepID=A0A1T4VCV9_9GAMM|nr:AraC family transcriptional regulator [Enterovibrio nigricans]SKA62782.1 AraC-type DNA-binding protein [Enterovibrio nigricans DSM 22720]
MNVHTTNRVVLRQIESCIATRFDQHPTLAPLFQAVANIELLDIGPSALAFHSACTLKDALTTLSELFSLINPMLKLHLAIQPNGDAELWLLDHEDIATEERSSALSQVYFFALIIRMIREALGRTQQTFELGLMQFQVDNHTIQELSELSNCTISNGHPVRRLFLTKDILNKGCRFANPALYQSSMTLANNELLTIRQQLVSQHVICVMQNMPLDAISLATIAQAINMSERSLSRKLNAEGVTPKQLMDRFKKEKALTLLLSGKENVTSVAYTLGYSDPSAFSRAFRRWTGQAPASLILS